MQGLSATEGSGEAAETQQTPNPPQLTIDEHGDHLVNVKIDGQMETMRLRDALQSVAHQRKVTQVSQDLRKYEAFFTELEKNPEFVISQLQEKFGVMANVEPPNQEENSNVEPNDDALAAMNAQIEELTSALEAQAQQRAHETQTAKVERELEALAAQYGDAFDRKAVLAYAVDNEIPNVTIAFQAWRFENLSQPQEPEGNGAVDKAEVLGAIAPGSPTATPPPPVPEVGAAKSPMDAIRRAAETLPEGSREQWLGALQPMN